jgi:hypothetical protein
MAAKTCPTKLRILKWQKSKMCKLQIFVMKNICKQIFVTFGRIGAWTFFPSCFIAQSSARKNFSSIHSDCAFQSGLPDGIHIFKPKFQIWVSFGGSCDKRCWDILCTFCSFYRNWVYFMAIWYIFWSLGVLYRFGKL